MSTNPQLLSWVICDNVHIDPATGKHYLLGCFSNIRARNFPATHPRMFWFLTLTDIKPGEHTLSLSIGVDMEHIKKLVVRKFRSDSPLAKINLINEIHNLNFPVAGNYQILIEVDDSPLLVTSFGVSD